MIVTIIVLIILATISIYAVLGENGIIAKAEHAKELQGQKTTEEEEGLNTLDQYVEDTLPYENLLPKGPNGKPLVTEITKTKHNTIIGEDSKGNQVVVPGGFKISLDSGTTVQQGIVIEDANQNQFVWIPVSNINHDGSNLIKLDDDSTVEVTLGRYTFARTQNADTGLYEDGTPIKVQYGSEYAATTLEAVTAGTVTSYRIGSYYYELTDVRESNGSSGADGTNSTAKDLAGFINSVSINKGYYIARYEASYASGSIFGVGNDSTYYKPASKVSTATKFSGSTVGSLWNNITQVNASKASRQMYYGDIYVESDLCNSYAWDTAIVYIQAMKNSNYANACDGNGTLKNTGETGDERCHIFDIAGNTMEWTTEYCTYMSSVGGAYPCTVRGGFYLNCFNYTSVRYSTPVTSSNYDYSFRVLLYM